MRDKLYNFTEKYGWQLMFGSVLVIVLTMLLSLSPPDLGGASGLPNSKLTPGEINREVFQANIHETTGKVMSIRVWNAGSGYTSTPTVTITCAGSDGLATATAQVGVPLMENRTLLLTTIQAETIRQAGPPAITGLGGDLTTGVNQTLQLRSVGGDWYKVSLS